MKNSKRQSRKENTLRCILERGNCLLTPTSKGNWKRVGTPLHPTLQEESKNNNNSNKNGTKYKDKQRWLNKMQTYANIVNPTTWLEHWTHTTRNTPDLYNHHYHHHDHFCNTNRTRNKCRIKTGIKKCKYKGEVHQSQNQHSLLCFSTQYSFDYLTDWLFDMGVIMHQSLNQHSRLCFSSQYSVDCLTDWLFDMGVIMHRSLTKAVQKAVRNLNLMTSQLHRATSGR